ncbi:hypothetical protein P5V15_004080 [Pogonomyrmex californicus]
MTYGSEHSVDTDRMIRVPSSDVSVNVRRRIVLFVAIRTRVSQHLAAFMPNQIPRPAETRVALRADVAGHVRPYGTPLRQLQI